MNSERIKEILRECNIGRSTYYRAIDELKRCHILSGKKNTFAIAENMFWKGDKNTRDALKKASMKVIFELVYSENRDSATYIDVDMHTA